jgi:hypothetical protein
MKTKQSKRGRKKLEVPDGLTDRQVRVLRDARDLGETIPITGTRQRQPPPPPQQAVTITGPARKGQQQEQQPKEHLPAGDLPTTSASAKKIKVLPLSSSKICFN